MQDVIVDCVLSLGCRHSVGPGISPLKHAKKCVFGECLKLTNIKSFLTERVYSNEARSESI
jgi:hypothetical protein